LLVATAGISATMFWETYWALRKPYDRGQVTEPEVTQLSFIGPRVGQGNSVDQRAQRNFAHGQPVRIRHRASLTVCKLHPDIPRRARS
jgi:hypothetical protein